MGRQFGLNSKYNKQKEGFTAKEQVGDGGGGGVAHGWKITERQHQGWGMDSG